MSVVIWSASILSLYCTRLSHAVAGGVSVFVIGGLWLAQKAVAVFLSAAEVTEAG